MACNFKNIDITAFIWYHTIIFFKKETMY